MGSKDQMIATLKQFATGSYRCLIISYESFRVHSNLLNGHCDIMLFDEGHRLKNMNVKIFQTVSKFDCSKRIILTGTPLQNSLDEFYSCINFVNPGIFNSLQSFRKVFAQPIMDALKTGVSPDILKLAR